MTTRSEIPYAVDQLHHLVGQTFGEDSDLFRAMSPLYKLACRELKELEESPQESSNHGKYRDVNDATRRIEARAIRNEYRKRLL